MSSTEATVTTTPLTDVPALVARGRAAGELAALPHYRAAGELLLEAKTQLSDREFGPWAKRHFGLSLRRAQKYMALAMLQNDVLLTHWRQVDGKTEP
jgi:hypothetical protein